MTVWIVGACTGNDGDMPELGEFPPAAHLGRELHIAHRLPAADRIVLTIPVVPEVLDDDGTIAREVLTTVLDEATGFVAVYASLPDWGSTASLAMRFAPVPIEARGQVVVDGRVVKAGKRLVFVEAVARWDGHPDRPIVALASGEFAKVGRRGDNLTMDLPPPDPDQVFAMGLEGSALGVPYRERLGLRVVDGPGGIVELPFTDYVRNSSGILHGGVVGALAVASVEAAAGERVTDAHVQYLSAGRHGPFRTSVERLDAVGTGRLWRTQTFDVGGGTGGDSPGHLMTRATATTASITP